MWSTALFSPSCSDVSWMWRRSKLPSGNRCCWLFIGTLLTYIPPKYRPWESYVTDRCTAAPRACKKVTSNWCHPSIWCLNVEIMEASSESPHGVVSRASMQLRWLEQAWAWSHWSMGLVHAPTKCCSIYFTAPYIVLTLGHVVFDLAQCCCRSSTTESSTRDVRWM